MENARPGHPLPCSTTPLVDKKGILVETTSIDWFRDDLMDPKDLYPFFYKLFSYHTSAEKWDSTERLPTIFASTPWLYHGKTTAWNISTGQDQSELASWLSLIPFRYEDKILVSLVPFRTTMLVTWCFKGLPDYYAAKHNDLWTKTPKEGLLVDTFSLMGILMKALLNCIKASELTSDKKCANLMDIGPEEQDLLWWCKVCGATFDDDKMDCKLCGLKPQCSSTMKNICFYGVNSDIQIGITENNMIELICFNKTGKFGPPQQRTSYRKSTY